jgi:hypothetical protein
MTPVRHHREYRPLVAFTSKGRRRVLWLTGAAVLAAVVIVPIYFYALAGGKRVLLIGDSLMVQSSAVTSAGLEARGYDVQVMAVPGSGLLDTDPRINWPARFTNALDSYNPDVVVVEFIGDYGLFGLRPGVVDGSPRFYSEWMAAAQEAENVLGSRHAVVYWVIGPPVQRQSSEVKLMTLDQIYEHLKVPHALYGSPPTIDMVTPFGGPNGQYTQDRKGDQGRVVQLRRSDGTHFTPAGELVFGETVTNAVSRGASRPKIFGG